MNANINFYIRASLKALALFIAFNVVLVFVDPMPVIARLSVYNWLVPGRERLPHARQPSREYGVTTSNLDVMFNTHVIHGRVKTADEYRVVVLGDSAAWGWKLRPAETMVGAMNAQNLITPDGRKVRVYNLGYPIASAMRDLLLLDYAMRYQPDMIIWMVTFETLSDKTRFDHPLVRDNGTQVRSLNERYSLEVDPALWELGYRDRTLFGLRRKIMADAFRLQLYGLPWAATGIDHDYFSPYDRVSRDLKEGDLFYDIPPKTLKEDEMTWDVVAAMHQLAGERPLLIVNEPILIADGKNSDVRYNNVYPRWIFDQYRALMFSKSAQEGWNYLDLWDLIPPDQFTDNEFHMTPDANRILARSIEAWMIEQWAKSEAAMKSP